MHRSVLFLFVLTSLSFGQSIPDFVKDAPRQTGRTASLAPIADGLEVRRARLVELNREALRAPAEFQRRLRFSLFPDAEFEAGEIRSYWSTDGETFLWHGRIAGMTRGHVVLAQTGDIVSASITTDGGAFYQIRQVEGELHVVQQVEAWRGIDENDAIRVPREALELARKGERLAGGTVERNAVGDPIIDVLVAYTATARSIVGSTSAMQNKINLAVAEVNQSFANSNVSIDLRLVHTMEVSYSETNVDAALTALAPNNGVPPTSGPLAPVHTARTTYGADLVSLWIHGAGSGGGVVGLGYQLDDSTDTSFKNFAFSTVEQNWTTGPSYAFGHELGHNMGCAHNRENAGGIGAFSYSYGYRQQSQAPRFRTLMAYSCSSTSCPVINYWSNPGVNYQSLPTGVSNSEDNARTLNNTRSLVSGFVSGGGGGGGCSYTLNPQSANYSSTGGTGSFSVTVAGTSCTWTPSTASAWINITSAGNVTGNGTVNYTVLQNTTNSGRNGSITVGGQVFSITQGALTVPVTIRTSPAGLQFQVDGTTYTDLQVFNWTPGIQHNIAAISPQNSAGGRFVFQSWSQGGSASQFIAGPNTSATYTVNYSASYLLTVGVTPSGGGTVSASPSSADGYYGSGTPVQLTATPVSGRQFTGWSGSVSGSTNPVSVTMNSAKSVTASFSALASCSYSISPGSDSVSASPAVRTVNVTTGSTCGWSASSNVSWLQTASQSTSLGSGTVQVLIADNTATSSRTGTVTIAGQTFTVTQSGAAPTPPPVPPPPPSAGLRFVSITPCRLMETRPEYAVGQAGNFGPPYMRAGETRTMTLSASTTCSIPSTAKAYVLNVTLVPRGSVDFATVWPGGESRPDYWTVRSPDGLIVANSAIVRSPAGAGALSVYTSNDTDVLIDVAGYFAESSNLVYYPLAPCRVIETRQEYRPTPGPFGPPSLKAQETRRYRFPSTPYCSIPSGAAAYSVTITLVPPQPVIFLTAWPAGGSRPNVSSINSPAGRILANSVIVPANSDSIDVMAWDKTDVLVDINGYFAPDNGSGLLYFPTTQCRVSDTLNGAPGSGFGGPIFENETTRTIPIPSSPRCLGIPSTAKAYALNVTAIPFGNPMPFLTLYPTGQARPIASLLNAFQGQTVSNAGIIPAGANGAVDIYAYRRTHVVVEIAGYFGR